MVRKKFQAFQSFLKSALIERDEEIDLLLTALLCSEHALMVGPPGTAKSTLARAVVDWIGGTSFSILLTKFTTPEEVFGPISLAGLKADQYRRVTTGKLPEASIAFVDEIWKASSAILNTLLQALNERTFANGGPPAPIPLMLCVAASNEWPGDQEGGKELNALFDRFLFRKSIRPIGTQRGLDRLLWSDVDTAPPDTVSPNELKVAIHDVRQVPWSANGKLCLGKIVDDVRREGVHPGDRRLRKSVVACQAAAWLTGASEVEAEHLEVLQHTLWDTPEAAKKTAEVVCGIANPSGLQVNQLWLEATEISSNLNVKDMAATAVKTKKLAEIIRSLRAITTDKAKAVTAQCEQMLKQIKVKAMEALD